MIAKEVCRVLPLGSTAVYKVAYTRMASSSEVQDALIKQNKVLGET